METIKDEYLLVRFSRLLRSDQPCPALMVTVNDDIATAIKNKSDELARIKLGLDSSSSDIQVTYTFNKKC
jgi:hypothetical protein